MVGAAERHREFVADLLSHGVGLRELQMMRIGRGPAADQAGLGGDEPKMVGVTPACGSLDQEPKVGWSGAGVGRTLGGF